MNDSIRAALVNVIKANRQKMSRYQRQKGIKPQRWLYPLATEKRYAATIRAWLRPMKDYVHSYLKENQQAILRGDSLDGGELHLDNAEAENISVTRLDAVPGKSFKTMIDSLNGWLGQYVPTDNEAVSGSPIYMGLGKIADSAFDFNEGQFEKGAKSILGVEFPVGEDWWPDARDLWAYNNYQAISGDMYKYVHDINGLVEKAVTSGLSVKELSKQITDLDEKLFKGRANFIARDQIGKLNGQITQMRMESVGLSMYIWETSGDERVRSTHRLMDQKLCRWDDASVYSEDEGKTWIDRPSNAVAQHPGMDYQCRCTAIAYWEELVGEADAQIDLLFESEHNIPNTMGALAMMKPTEKQTAEATEQQRLQQSIQQTHKTASEMFPGETWDSVDTIKLKYERLPDKLEGIKIARSRLPVNKSQEKDLIKELLSARVLKNLGASVYLVPKMKRPDGSGEMPGPDAIVNGKLFEFKDVTGSIRRFEDRFRESRVQGKNVYFRIESPNITRQDIVRKLFGIINDSSYKGGYQGDIVFTLGSGKSEKTYFLKIKDLKKK